MCNRSCSDVLVSSAMTAASVWLECLSCEKKANANVLPSCFKITAQLLLVCACKLAAPTAHALEEAQP